MSDNIPLIPLVKNEVLKVLFRKRFLFIVLVLVVLIPVFVYAQLQSAKEREKQFGTDDWHVIVQQQIYDMTNRLGSARVPEEWKRIYAVQIQQLEYYLEHDVNPSSPSGVTFTRMFLSESASVFIPLLVLAIASDLVSGERTLGTIKLLLSRPAPRWKILLAKLLALWLYVSLIVVISIALSYLISGAAFGYGGWDMPVFAGFLLDGTDVDTSRVVAVSQAKYVLMQAGLVWYSAVSVAGLAFLVSVLVRSTAASIVIMMAAVTAGTILANMANAWESAKYLFVLNLDLPRYLSGAVPPVDGMTLSFSMTVLGLWSLAAIVASFIVFSRQDIYN